MRIALIRYYYSTNNCTTAAIRKYNTENNLRKAPCTVTSLLNLVQKFEETGSVADRPNIGRTLLSDKRMDAVKEVVREIDAINEWGVSFVRSILQSTGIPRTYVHSKLRTKLSYKKNVAYQCATNCNPPITKSRRNSAHGFQNTS